MDRVKFLSYNILWNLLRIYFKFCRKIIKQESFRKNRFHYKKKKFSIIYSSLKNYIILKIKIIF